VATTRARSTHGSTKGKKRVSLKLTAEQQKQVKQAIGKNAVALELTAEELEERIAPITSPRDPISQR